jgi:hypothetical protein
MATQPPTGDNRPSPTALRIPTTSRPLTDKSPYVSITLVSSRYLSVHPSELSAHHLLPLRLREQHARGDIIYPFFVPHNAGFVPLDAKCRPPAGYGDDGSWTPSAVSDIRALMPIEPAPMSLSEPGSSTDQSNTRRGPHIPQPSYARSARGEFASPNEFTTWLCYRDGREMEMRKSRTRRVSFLALHVLRGNFHRGLSEKTSLYSHRRASTRSTCAVLATTVRADLFSVL